MIGLLALGCGDDVAATSDTDTDTDGTTTSTTDPTMATTPGTTSTGIDPDTSGTDDPETDTEDPGTDTEDPGTDTEDPSDTDDTDDTSGVGEPADFIVTIENISNEGPVPTPFSPGVWVEQDATVAPIFSINTAASEGLVLLAEDGNPATLATEIEGLDGVLQSTCSTRP